jgi:hypothetical protein
MAYDEARPESGVAALNGQYWIAGGAGEPEVEEAWRIVYVPNDVPAPAEVGDQVVLTDLQGDRICAINYSALRHLGVAKEPAAVIAWLRMLAISRGVVSRHFLVAQHHVRYNEAHGFDWGDAAIAAFAFGGRVTGAATYAFAFRDADNMWDILTAERCAVIEAQFSDMICCVAWAFRVRGHHYTEDLEPRYANLWNRCLHPVAPAGVTWEHIAVHALHAVMPDVLDSYWRFCVEHNYCAGALHLRYNSASAGTAALFVVYRGLADVVDVFPKIEVRVRESMHVVQAAVAELQVHRWRGSINHRFYDEPAWESPTDAIGHLAAYVLGVHRELVDASKVARSPALAKAADMHPVLTSIVSLCARVGARRIAEVQNLLLVEDHPP